MYILYLYTPMDQEVGQVRGGVVGLYRVLVSAGTRGRASLGTRAFELSRT